MTIHLKVKPGSKVNQLFYDAAGQLNVKIRAPAQDGKANAYLVDFLAKQLGVAKSNVTIVAGFTNPYKRIEIDVAADVYEAFMGNLSILYYFFVILTKDESYCSQLFR